MPRQNKNSVTVSVTMPVELDSQIREIAKAESRSFSNTFVMLLTRMLALRALEELKTKIQEVQS